jgi:hypothetical protein
VAGTSEHKNRGTVGKSAATDAIFHILDRWLALLGKNFLPLNQALYTNDGKSLEPVQCSPPIQILVYTADNMFCVINVRSQFTIQYFNLVRYNLLLL